jgi:hypothetical protein
MKFNNFKLGDFVDRIYPIELEITDTTYKARSFSYLDLHLEIYSEAWLRTVRRGAQFVPIGIPTVENTSIKHNKFVNQKLEHSDDISFRVLFGRISVFMGPNPG